MCGVMWWLWMLYAVYALHGMQGALISLFILIRAHPVCSHIDTGTPSMLYLSCALTLQKKGITCTGFGGWLRLGFSVCRSGVHAGSLLLVKFCLRCSALSKVFRFSVRGSIWRFVVLYGGSMEVPRVFRLSAWFVDSVFFQSTNR